MSTVAYRFVGKIAALVTFALAVAVAIGALAALRRAATHTGVAAHSPARPNAGVTHLHGEALETSRFREYLEAAFIRDTPDPAWMARLQPIAFTKVMNALPEGSTLRSVECRQSICRVETSHPDRQQYMQFMPKPLNSWTLLVARGASLCTEFDGAPQTAGALVMVSYIGRGGPLPVPD